MQSIPYYLSQTIAILLYPMLIPTYGIALYYAALSHQQSFVPAVAWIGIIGTLVFTLLLPLSILLVMVRRGNITDLFIRASKDRTMPYIYSTICYGFWAYFCMQVMKLDMFVILTAWGATSALLFVTVINLKWKISAHLTALGGLCGGLIGYHLTTGTDALVSMLVVCGIALALMWARIYDKSHTPLQVVCGFLLGLACTGIPIIIAL